MSYALPDYLARRAHFGDCPPGHRFGLYFDGWEADWRKPTNKTPAFKTVADAFPAHSRSALGALRARQQSLADDLGDAVLSYPARLSAPLATGLGNEHPLENGFAFLNPHGLPYLAGSGVKVASVATAFPSGQSPTEIKVAETRAVVELGADEVDMVIDRGAFLSGRYSRVYDEIVRVKEACGEAHLKVILETGELGTYDNVRRASLLAIAAGADFVKTSTGKISPAATLPVTLCMMEVVRDVHAETGHKVGIKPAGGIRTSKQAVQYLVTLYETLGPEWMTPDLFRFGASSLLNDVLMQVRKERTGRYQSQDYFTID